MTEIVNLQVIIDTIGFMLVLSVPIGVMFGVVSKVVNFFFSMAFGDRNIKL